VSDVELDEAVETVDLSFDMQLMNNSVDEADYFKLNVIAQVWQQPARGASYAARPIHWTVYNQADQLRLADVYYGGPGGHGVGPGASSTVLSGPIIALYVLLPIAFFIALIVGHYWYKRRRSPPIPLDIFDTNSGGEAELSYHKHTDDTTTEGVYSNGTNGTNGTNGHSHSFAVDEYENEKKEAPTGQVEMSDVDYVANPTPANNFYTQ